MSLPSRHTLLIIDRSEEDLATATELFGGLFDLVTCHTVQEGVRLLREKVVHVILTDQGIPQMLQKYFLKEMPGDYPEAIQTIFTGDTELDLIMDAINQGYLFRYVSKPWKKADLRDVLTVATRQYDQIVERNLLLAELEQKNQELLETNRQLKELDGLKTAFMAVASHELRTPVTLIGGFASLLDANAEKVTPEKLKDTTSKIIEGARRLERIIRAMFQMLESGEVAESMHIEDVDPVTLVQSALEDAQPFVEKRQIQLHLELNDAPKIQVDASKMKDVLDNLILNAIKFTPDEGQIDLIVNPCPETEMVEIIVRDHGVGIPEQDQQHIFKPIFSTFDTLHHSSGVYEFQRRGIGLGLAVSKKFVELHEGTIELHSVPDEGTTITVRIPTVRSAQSES